MPRRCCGRVIYRARATCNYSAGAVKLARKLACVIRATIVGIGPPTPCRSSSQTSYAAPKKRDKSFLARWAPTGYASSLLFLFLILSHSHFTLAVTLYRSYGSKHLLLTYTCGEIISRRDQDVSLVVKMFL